MKYLLLKRRPIGSALLIVGLGFASNRLLSAGIDEDWNSAKDVYPLAAGEINSRDYATLKFDPNVSQVTPAQESELKTLLAASRDNGRIKEVLVIAYADVPYPADQKSDLPKASRVLAERRGFAVKRKLEDLGAITVKVVDMASKPYWFDRAFITRDALIKQEVATEPDDASSDDLFYQTLGARLKVDGGPGTVVVAIRHEIQ